MFSLTHSPLLAAAASAFFGGHISLPIEPGADRVLADQMMREIARTSGIDWWE